jgi:iron complex outermembrane recepter protein
VNGDADLIAGGQKSNILKTSGIDVGLSYKTDVGAGMMSVTGNLTYLNKYIFNNDGNDRQFAGLLSGDFGNLAKWRSNLRLGYDVGGFGVAVNWQRIGKLVEATDGPDTDLADRNPVKTANYFDLSLNYRISENVKLYSGILNFFDRKIEQIPNQISNSDVNTYDPLGRRFYIGGKFNF